MSTTINGTTGINKIQDGTVVDADIAALSASKLTGTLPAGMGGKVLQVVSTKHTTPTTINSTTFQNTNLMLSITPSSTSSKILVMVTASVGGDDYANAYLYGGLFRDGTELFEILGQRDQSNAFGGGMSMTYLDSPSTTSSTTYKFRGRANNSAMDFRYNYVGGQSTITLMEIGV